MPFGVRSGPHRHELVLRRSDVALVIVDLQERLLREVTEPESVVANAAKLARTAAVLGLPVIITEHNAAVFGFTAEPVRRELPAVTMLHKMIFSCFSMDDFRERVAGLGRHQLLVAGLETHICVGQTALDGIGHGYAVHVARDACASRRKSDHDVGVEKMAAAGVVPCTTEMAMFELLERAGTEEFRALLPLIKNAR